MYKDILRCPRAAAVSRNLASLQLALTTWQQPCIVQGSMQIPCALHCQSTRPPLVHSLALCPQKFWCSHLWEGHSSERQRMPSNTLRERARYSQSRCKRVCTCKLTFVAGGSQQASLKQRASSDSDGKRIQRTNSAALCLVLIRRA